MIVEILPEPTPATMAGPLKRRLRAKRAKKREIKAAQTVAKKAEAAQRAAEEAIEQKTAQATALADESLQLEQHNEGIDERAAYDQQVTDDLRKRSVTYLALGGAALLGIWLFTR